MDGDFGIIFDVAILTTAIYRTYLWIIRAPTRSDCYLRLADIGNMGFRIALLHDVIIVNGTESLTDNFIAKGNLSLTATKHIVINPR